MTLPSWMGLVRLPPSGTPLPSLPFALLPQTHREPFSRIAILCPPAETYAQFVYIDLLNTI